MIVCGSPESGAVREWYPTIPSVAESHVFWYGDNLPVMREHIGDDTVDLIYLDPPFNSQRIYNRIFPEKDGSGSEAQRKAFEDYWRWGAEAESAYNEIVHPRSRRYAVPATLSQTMEMFRGVLRESNMLAYLSMMGVRLIEMRRVLKRSGSLYLHCDPTASHYLKLLLDALFGQDNFQSEIIWKRSGAHSDSKQGRRGHGHIHDTILFYTKTDEWTWTDVFIPYTDSYVGRDYRLVEDGTGRRFRRDNLTAAKPGGDTSYEWRVKKRRDIRERWTADLDDEFRRPLEGWQYKAIGPYKGRYWAYSKENMRQFALEGRLRHTFDGMPEYKRYLDEMPGVSLQDLWTDIPGINSGNPERVGFPTQKPVGLLERIIRSSTTEGDLVLDPFCGCGTAIVAAQKLNRKWIGIDVTHVAVSVLKKRLESDFPGLRYRVRGEPEDVASARRLADDKWEEFQAWIVDKVGGIPLTPEDEKKVAKKGKDGGVDGYFMFRDDPKALRSKRMILSVKAGKALAPDMVDSLNGVVTRERVAAGALLTAYPVSKGMLSTAAACGSYESELFAPGKRYPRIQVVTVEDIFDPRWRGLEHPGSNTSRRSEPPAGTEGASGDLFKQGTAFRDMLERDFPLSQKQREWVHEAALRLGVKDEPAENTFSVWSADKQRREREQAKKQPYEEMPRPAKPPGRR